jgi:hypothetical protein
MLAGAEIGASHATMLRERALATGLSTVGLVLDLQGVESITASYLKQIVAVFEPAAQGQPEIYPFVANIGSSDVRFELEAYLSGADRAMQEITLLGEGFGPASLLGRLESSAADTYRELTERGPATAAELHERHASLASGQSTWNNRLVRLFELRLAHRQRVGRHWIYRPAYNLN